MVTANENGRDLERLTTLIEAVHITSQVDRAHPFEQVRAAIFRLVAGRVRGKLALTVRPSRWWERGAPEGAGPADVWPSGRVRR